MRRLIPYQNDTAQTFGMRQAQAIREAAQLPLSAQDLSGTDFEFIENPEDLYKWLRLNVQPYTDKEGAATIPTPSEVLRTGFADCKGYAVLGIAAARAAGLQPTALALYGNDGNCFKHCAFFVECPYESGVVLVDALAEKSGELQRNPDKMPACVGAALKLR